MKKPTRLALVALAACVAVGALSLQRSSSFSPALTVIFASSALLLAPQAHWASLFALIAWSYSGANPPLGLLVPVAVWLICADRPNPSTGRARLTCHALALFSLTPFALRLFGAARVEVSWALMSALAVGGFFTMAWRVIAGGMDIRGPSGLTLLVTLPYGMNLALGSFLYPEAWQSPALVQISTAWLALWPLGLVYYYMRKTV